jgi:hypothetical protein
LRGHYGHDDHATDVAGAAYAGVQPQESGKKKRQDAAVWVRPQTHALIKKRAQARGVSMSSYVENALLTMRTPLPPTAEVAVPLAAVAYRLAQIADALERDDDVGVRTHLSAAHDIVARALLRLRKRHQAEVRDLQRVGEDWHG